MNSQFFSQGQKRLVGATITYGCMMLLLGLLVLTVYLLGQVLSFFDKVVWPLVISCILALLLRPVIAYSQKRLGLRPASSVLLLYLILMIAGGVLLISFLPFIVNQAIEAMEVLPGLLVEFFDYLKLKFPALFNFIQEQSGINAFWENSDLIVNALKRSMPTVRELGSDFAVFCSWVTALGIIPLYLFYILNSKTSFMERFGKEIMFIKEKWRDDLIYLFEEYISIMVSFFRGQLLIALIMGVLFALSFTIIDLRFGIILGLGLGLLNIVPYLGTIIGLLTVLPISYFQQEGGWALLGMSLGTFIVVQLIESYFLTPRIMGKETGLHPMVIIVSIFFWGIALGGIIGMILAIPLTASLIVTWHLIKKNYLI